MRKILYVLLTVLILCSCKSQPLPQIHHEPKKEIKDPEFQVFSIVILQADIVVTEFETVIKIINPNDFAVELTSLTYELFGNGASWSKGTGKDKIQIPPMGTGQAKFIFQMNFINMNRKLLDDVIAMRSINYRLKGNAEVHPDIPRTKPFLMTYDCSGLSEVRRN